MASATVSLALINDTDANFRIWGKAISDQIKTSWTQTTDTGQINWATVTKPATTFVTQGYEIFKSNDAAGSLVDIYIKIEYGSGAATATAPLLAITVGFGSTGAGNLNGVVSNRKLLYINNTPSTTPVICNLGVGTGWICMILGTTSLAFMIFSIERTRNSTLAFQNEILFINHPIPQSGANFWTSQVVNQTTAFPEEGQNTGAGAGITLINTSTNLQSGVVGLSLWAGCRAGITNPSMNLFGCANAQLGSPQNIISFTTYGGTHSYIINVSPGSNLPCFAGSTAQQLLSRFE